MLIVVVWTAPSARDVHLMTFLPPAPHGPTVAAAGDGSPALQPPDASAAGASTPRADRFRPASPLTCHTVHGCLHFTTDAPHHGPALAAATDELLVLAEGRGVGAYDLANGRRRWHTDLGIRADHPVPRVTAVRGAAAVLVSPRPGELVALAAADGDERWRGELAGNGEVLTARLVEGQWLLVVHVREGRHVRELVGTLPATDAALPWRDIHGPDRRIVATTAVADPEDLDRTMAAVLAPLWRGAGGGSLQLRQVPGIPGGLVEVVETDSGRRLAGITYAAYHAERLGRDRWLVLAPRAALVLDLGHHDRGRPGSELLP
ncbi:PQQ-binding-like beta-propeller repeat protein [Egicoccus sp. AB-alg2]|uniref:outer membrane protein assembly factor BamB family protein n=1 Tax=Egicoccus sp. AB-alg2 TaxID=3242693 RepID=UPI00359D43E4